MQWVHGCLEKDWDLSPWACWHWGKPHYWNNSVSSWHSSAGGENSSEPPKAVGQEWDPLSTHHTHHPKHNEPQLFLSTSTGQ